MHDATTAEDSVRLAEGEISPEQAEAMKAMIGTRLRIDASVHNEDATRMSIRKFAEASGDPNPLWCDADYAAGTVYGQLVASPFWVTCCFAGIQFGWPGLGAFHNESSVRFHRPVFVGDRIESSCTYTGFDGPKPSSFAGEMVIDHFHNEYRNQHGDLVVENDWDVIRFQRAKARSTQKLSTLQVPHQWDARELAEIEERVLAEQPRGAVPRYWDDVQVGDRLDPIVKGPIGIGDEVAYVAAGGMPIPRMAAHRAALLAYRKHPKWAFRDPVTHALEPVFAVHYNIEAAKAMGVPTMYDAGFQRQSWGVHLLTDWMGDDGWLKAVSGRYRQFVYVADVLELSGEVTGKEVDADGDHVVTVQTWAHNQRGDDVMPGRATVALPTRAGDNPARRRVESRRD